MNNRRFSNNDQIAFAALSGDYNPIHMDPKAARRLIYGYPVVHGVHLVFWAVDNLMDKHNGPLRLQTLKFRFRSPVRVGDHIYCLIERKDDNRAKIILTNHEHKAAEIQLAWVERGEHDLPTIGKDTPGRCECRTLTADQAAAASGSLNLSLNLELATELFPNVVAVLPALQIAVILATTRLVGMECPGLHSIYSALDLTFDKTIAGLSELTYEAAEYDDRFSLLSMRIIAPGAGGTIQAFLRPAPKEQIRYTDLRQVGAHEFTGQCALVVGGSRGLGEVTAKVLAAGGANVRITYYRGRDDAQRIVDEISASGGNADCLALDVLNISQDLADHIGGKWTPTHVYYFATPPILGTKGIFSAPLFDKFCSYYVKGFLNIFQATLNLSTDLQKVYYPSSEMVIKMPDNMGEYVAAKLAGEALCRFLEKSNRSVKIISSRLPRLATDQTQSLLPVASADPVPWMLEELRRFRDA